MSFLSNFDVFQQPISLNLNNNNNLSTISGKIMTLFVFSYALFALMRSDLFLKVNPRITVEQIRPFLRPHIYFNNSNFTLAFGLFHETFGYVSDPTIFKFSAGLSSMDNIKNDFLKFERKVDFCSEEDFRVAGNNFKKTNRSNLYCLNLKNDDLQIFGALNEVKMQIAYITLDRCKNSTENNYICKTLDEQNEFLQKTFVDIVLQNNLVDYSDLDNPIKNDVNKYYTSIDINFSKLMTAKIKHVRVDSDKGFFFNEIDSKDFYSGEDVFHDFKSGSEDQALLEIQLIPDEKETIHTRVYQHIAELLAQIGGILNILMLTAIFIVNIELPYLMTKILSTGLYSFQSLDYEQEITKETGDSLEQEGREENVKFENDPFEIGIQNISSSKEKEKVFSSDFLLNRRIINKSKKERTEIRKSLTLKKDENKNTIKYNLIEENKLPFFSKHFTEKFRTSPISIPIPQIKGDFDTATDHSISIKDFKIKKYSKSISINKIENDEKKKSDKTMGRRTKFFESLRKKIENLKKKEELSKFVEIINFKKSFPINFCSYLSILLRCKKFRLKPKEKLFLLGEEQINKDLDVLKIINLMNDVEKLKMILLNKKQRYLFNLLKKPLITLKDEDSVNNTILSSIKIRIKKDLVETYYRELIHNKNRSEIDERILQLLDQDIINYKKELHQIMSLNK